MEPRLHFFLLIATALLLLYIIYMVKRNTLDLKYSLVWLFVSVALLVFAAIPDFLDCVGNAIGIKMPENTIFFLMIGFQLFILFSLSVALSRNSGRVRRMAQELAMMKRKIEELNGKVSDGNQLKENGDSSNE